MSAPVAAARPPRVSVLVPAYNVERYVEQSLDTILAQTFSDFEMIVVDDGSTDGTRAALERVAVRDARVRVISRPNTGIVGALNDALAVATGDLIARMDGDDLAVPERFAKQVAFLDAHPDVVMVGSRVLLVDDEGLPLGDMAGVARTSAEIAQSLLRGGWPIVHPSVMIRGAALRAVGGYRPGTFPYEDHDLFLRLLAQGRIENLGEQLLQYRRHPASVVATQKDTRQTLYDVIDHTRAARGEPPIDRPPSDPPTPGYAQRREWTWLALKHGHPRTARKYAVRGLRERPFDAESWKVLFCALRGR